MKNLAHYTTIGLLALASATATAGVKEAEKKGAREGRQYARDLVARGIEVDRTACAVGMAAGDTNNPQYNQAEIEAYAKAFGNACIGTKVL
jgi:hypothetical protein